MYMYLFRFFFIIAPIILAKSVGALKLEFLNSALSVVRRDERAFIIARFVSAKYDSDHM